MRRKQRLLISVRGMNEAVEAARGGAHIADVEYPASALGTPYPLNIRSVRNKLNGNGFKDIMVSTNIGETQYVRASSCQAALGVALAGADYIKFGLAEQSLGSAIYLARNIIRSVRELAERTRKLYPAVFVDEDMCRFFEPFEESVELATESKADGVLIDTFNKSVGKGLLDYCKVDRIAKFAENMHTYKKEAWIAGSIALEELPELWRTGVDVICVRGAACVQDGIAGRFGNVVSDIVEQLVATIPRRGH